MFAYTKLMQAMAAAGVVSATDPYFNLTTLLLPGNGTNGAQNNTFLDSSTNNFTITRNGNATQGTFTPFSQTGWGNNFSSSYLTTPSNAAFAMGTGDFTIETFAYYTSFANVDALGLSNWNGVTWSANNWSFHLDHATQRYKISFWVNNYSSSAQILLSTTTIALNTWYHIAVSRSGNTWRLFVNGALEATTTSSVSLDGGISPIIYIAGTGNGTQYYTGNLSNTRIVKGTAVYTSNFTPSTTPLTAISGTSLLTCQSNRFVDNSSNAFAITVNGTPSVQSFSPFAPTAAYSAATNGGSGYFDGTGDYLTVPAGSAFAPSTGDFTVDGWIYPTSGAAIQRFWAQSTSGTNYFLCEADVPNKTIRFIGTSSGGGTAIVSAATLQLNAWNHFCVSRTSGTVTVWCNGSAGTPTSNTTDFNNTSYTPTISGYSHSTGSEPVIGYLSGLRYIKGTALSGSTVPTSPPTAVTNTSFLGNFTNGGITDATSKNDLETVGNAQISTTQSKWGGSSMYFDGTGDWLYNAASSPNYAFGTGDFTVEMWVYPTSNPANGPGTLIDARNSGTSEGWVIRIFADLSVGFYDGPANTYQQTAASAISLNTWTYLAFKRSGTTLTIYVNGTSAKTATVSSNLGTSWPLYIGNNYSAGYTYYGYIDDLRITKGYARTISASPTAAFALQ